MLLSLYQNIVQLASNSSSDWFQKKFQLISQNIDDEVFFFNFSSVSKRFKAQVGEIKISENTPAFLLNEAVRVAFLLKYSQEKPTHFEELLKKLKSTADTAELISINKGMILYPYSSTLRQIAEESLRSNIKSLFESVAHNNAFPKEYFDEISWNQMILKALFIESAIYKIFDFDARKNAELNRMAEEYALERISASRPVNIELWRCLNIISNPRIYDYWLKILPLANELEKDAILLTLQELKSSLPDDLIKYKKEVQAKHSWLEIGQQLEKQRKVSAL